MQLQSLETDRNWIAFLAKNETNTKMEMEAYFWHETKTEMKLLRRFQRKMKTKTKPAFWMQMK